MNIAIVLKEIKNPAIREIVSDLEEIVVKVRRGDISYQQGSMEVVGRKHIVQGIALDWAFNRRIKSLEIK